MGKINCIWPRLSDILYGSRREGKAVDLLAPAIRMSMSILQA